jgi:phosphotransferase system enzyme I (PtsI)
MPEKKKIVKTKEIRLKGVPICGGVAIGSPFHFFLPEEKFEEFLIEDRHVEDEINRYRKALQRSRLEVQKLKSRLEQERAWDGVAILDTHLHMLQDPSLTDGIEQQIRIVHKNTEAAVRATVSEYQKRFNKISDTFFQERFKDVQDISRRILRHLQEDSKFSLADLPIDSIVFAEELSPSDAAEARSTFIGAFVTQKGGETSHTAIMAKAQGIPYVANVDLSSVDTNQKFLTIVDGFKGEVIINPNKTTLNRYQELLRAWRGRSVALCRMAHLPAETTDGHGVRLTANVDSTHDIELLHQYGGQGVGLFRSESILMSHGEFPSEEEQFYTYKTMVERLKGLPIVLRTFDIGGDKFGRFYVVRREDNPFLGCRAIRLMLKEKEIFKTQLRAMLRASYYGNVKILFPMISGLSELQAAKLLIEESKQELRIRGEKFGQDYKIGCMIEVPSAALIADALARECDFLSLGTNDLTQYCIAVDRGNQALNYLYTPLHPSILRIIKMVVEEGKRSKKPVTVCGEMAADPRYTSLLLGLGVDELSVIPRSLPLIKEAVRNTNIIDAKELAKKALLSALPEDVHSLLKI